MTIFPLTERSTKDCRAAGSSLSENLRSRGIVTLSDLTATWILV